MSKRIVVTSCALGAAVVLVALWARPPWERSSKPPPPHESMVGNDHASSAGPTARMWPPPRRGQNAATRPPSVQSIPSTPSTSDPYAVPAPSPPVTALTDSPPQEVPENFREFRKATETYFQRTLVPRVRDCWKSLDGKGTIEFRYGWMFDAGIARPAAIEGAELPVMMVESSLTPEQSKRALECMLEAVDGTSFAATSPYPEETAAVGYQVWHVGPIDAGG